MLNSGQCDGKPDVHQYIDYEIGKSIAVYASCDKNAANTPESIVCGEKKAACTKSNTKCSALKDCVGDVNVNNIIGSVVCQHSYCYYDAIAKEVNKISDAGILGVSAQLTLKKPLISIRIPGVSFSDINDNIDSEGYVHIPYLAQYLAALYKFGLVAASLIAVAMVIKKGFDIAISPGGEAKTEAFQRIGSIVAGLLLVWGSYFLLNAINPDLVSFRVLKVKYIPRQELPAEEDEEGIDTSGVATPTGPVKKPTWDYKTFDCAKKDSYQEAGVVPKSAVITYTCPGLKGAVTTIPEMKDPLCKAAKLAQDEGFALAVGPGSYRSFQEQAAGWCGPSAKEYPDPAVRKSYRAVPGGSAHGLGRAVDVYLVKNGKQLFGANSKAQCDVPLEYVQKIANYFYKADANFNRLEREIWHFEYGTAGQQFRNKYTGYTEKCKK